jgi:hypothetical protein
MKRRFDFRLERVRRVRALEERVAGAERARAEGLARAAEASRDKARTALERSRAERETLLSGALGALDPRGVLGAQRGLDAELARLRRTVESARTLRTQAERMAAVHRERKAAERALDELRGRARQRHDTALGKADAAELDEAAQRLAEAARRRARRPTDGAAREEGSSPVPPRADHASGSPPPA